MKKILLLYASLTGYTKSIAEELYTSLKNEYRKYSIDISNITEINISKLKEYNSIILGASTWDGNLNPDADEFFKKFKLDKRNLSGVTFALFGVGDNSYPDFCGAIDTIKRLIELYKGSVYGDIPKINSYWDVNITETLRKWVKLFLSENNNKPKSIT